MFEKTKINEKEAGKGPFKKIVKHFKKYHNILTLVIGAVGKDLI